MTDQSLRETTSWATLSANRRWQYAITAVFATTGVSMATWFSRIPTIRDNLQASTSQMSVLLLGLSVGSIAGLSLAPKIINRWGTRHGLLVCTITTGVGLSLTGLCTDTVASLAGGCAALAVFGFAHGSTDVLMNVEGARAEAAIGHTRLPMMHGFFSIGTIAGAALGAMATSLAVPASIHLGVMAAITALVGALAVLRLPPNVIVHDLDEAPHAPGGWFDRRLAFVGIILAGAAFAEGAGNDWISLAAVDGHDFSNAGGAYIYGILVTAMTVGRLAGGRFLDRFGPSVVLAALSAVAIVGVILMIVGTGTATVVLGAALWGLGLSLAFPACISAAADHPHHPARRVSIVSICGYATFLVGPPAIGFIGEHAGILVALWLAAGTLAIALLCTPAIRRPRS